VRPDRTILRWGLFKAAVETAEHLDSQAEDRFLARQNRKLKHDKQALAIHA
jgi:hypothetical protein